MQGLELLVAAVAAERLQDVRLYVRCGAHGVGPPRRVLPAELGCERVSTAAVHETAGAVLPPILRDGEEGRRGTLAQVVTRSLIAKAIVRMVISSIYCSA